MAAVPDKIEIKHFDLEFERNFQTTESYLELHDTYLRYVAKYDSEHPKDREDLLAGWEERFHDFDTRIKRDAFISVEYYWNDKNNYWQLEMEANGYPVAITLYFEKGNEKEMNTVFFKLFAWVFKC